MHPRHGILRLASAVIVASVALLTGAHQPASAHPLSTTAVLLEVHPDRVEAELQLPLDRLGIALGREVRPDEVSQPQAVSELRAYVETHLSVVGVDGRTWSSPVRGGRVEVVDDVDHLVLDAVLTPPDSDVGAFDLRYDAIVERLVSHRVFVTARHVGASEGTQVAVLSWQQQQVLVDPADLSPSPSTVTTVRLGFEHISGGSDHQLFLVLLLLPSSATARDGRWIPARDARRTTWRVVQVATAFAIGHSLTLALGASGLVLLPSRLVEAGIALSVLVSAVHAVRPLVRRGEALIAGGFGLLHGLAFATLLDELGLTSGDLLWNLLGFNVGIELTQLVVLALLLPSLLVLNRTRAYPAVRVAVAGMGAVVAAGWLFERVGLLDANPLEAVGDLLVEHPLGLAGALALAALIAHGIPQLRLEAR